MNSVNKLSGSLNKIHVFGGTSDAVLLCQMLADLNLNFSLSVATEAGGETASGLTGKVCIGRMDVGQMQSFFIDEKIDLVIDATHPFAAEVSKNIIQATDDLALPLIRYERLTQIDLVENPLLIKVKDVAEACSEAKKYGDKVFLTTGSKELPNYKKQLSEKTLIARVLPTVEVIQSCVDLGLGIGEVVAMKGPFTQAINKAMYEFYQPDVVITKESGAEGGYSEKVLPCLDLDIPCIVICRPKQVYQNFVSTIEELKNHLQKFE